MRRYITLALLPLIIMLFFAGDILAAENMDIRYLNVSLVTSRLRVRNYLDVDYSGTYADAFNVNYTGSGNYILNLMGDGVSVFSVDKDGNVVMAGGMVLSSLSLLDTDASNNLSLVWNEDDSSNRTLNFLVGSGDRSLTLNEDFTIGNGFGISATAEDAASSILLDNVTLEVENAFAAQRLFKLIQGTDAAATLTAEGANSVTNQDTTTDGNPQFASITGDHISVGGSGEDVRAYGATGDGSTDDRTAINDAHTAATANGGVLFFPSGGANNTYRIGSNITFNSNVRLYIDPGATLAIDTGVVVTINARIAPTLHKIFTLTGTGVATLGAESCVRVLPQWWGAVGDDATDNAVALNKAMVQAANIGQMFIPAGTYQLSAPIDTWSYGSLAAHTGGPDIVGAGMEDTILKYTGATGFAISVDNPDDTSFLRPNYINIRDLQIQCPSLSDPDDDSGGILFAGANFCTVERVAFHDFNGDGAYIKTRSRWLTDTESSMTHDTDRDFTTTGAGASEKYAIKFTSRAVGSTWVRSVTVQLKRTGTPAGTIKAAIYTDSSGPDTKTGTYSATVSNAALSAAADGSAVEFTFDSLDDDAMPLLAASTVYWVVLETEGYTYTDGATEVIIRADAGDGAASGFGTFTFGGAWALTADGSNNSMDFAYDTVLLLKVISCQAHAATADKAKYGIQMEHFSQVSMIGTSFYVGDGVAVGAGVYSYGPDNILYISDNSQLSTASITPPIEVHGGESNITQSYLEGGGTAAGSRILFDRGLEHTIKDTHVATRIDWTDGTRVNFDMPKTLPYSDDGQYAPRDFFLKVYDLGNSPDVTLVSGGTVAADGDALNDVSILADAQNEGFTLDFTASTTDYLPRGSYLITIVAKDTNQVANDLYIESAYKTGGGGNVTMFARQWTMTAEYRSFQFVHVLTEAEMQLGGSRILVIKVAAGANAINFSHMIVEYLGPDINFQKNLVAFSSDISDADGDRESKVIFVGRRSGEEQAALASINALHDGAADDEKGRLEIRTGDGTDGFAPTLAAYWDSAQEFFLKSGTGVSEISIDDTLAGDSDDVIVTEQAIKAYVDGAMPAGTLDTYTAVVAASGGDYTSIVTACSTELAGAHIYVKRGTYTPSADIVMKDGQKLVGESKEDTVIDFSAADRNITNAGGSSSQQVYNFTLQNSIADYYVDLQGNYSRIENCLFIGSGNSYSGAYINGSFSIITKCDFTSFSRNSVDYCANIDNLAMISDCTFFSSRRGIYLDTASTATGNVMASMLTEQVHMESGSVLTGNRLGGGRLSTISGDDLTISGNYVSSTATGFTWDNGHDYATFTGNHFENAAISATNAGAAYVTITGNTFSTGVGVYMAGDYFDIVGNTFVASAFVDLQITSAYGNTAVNNFNGSTSYPHIADAGTANSASGNTEVSDLQEKTFQRLENQSGGALVAGDVVILSSTAAGDEYTTTTTQGDDKAWGMVEENTNNSTYGMVQTHGETDKLKVDGTTDIVVGDFIGTFTSAGIGMKAGAGDMAFAIAMEAYATDDSSGVIDALLITPRKIGLKPDYAGIYFDENGNPTTINLVEAFELIADFDTDQPENISDGDNTINAITIGATGDYDVRFSMSLSSAGSNKLYELFGFEVAVSGTAVTGVSNDNPCLVTANSHPFSNGDYVKIVGVGGATGVNDRIFTVANAGANDFTLDADDGTDVDGAGFGVYASPGTVFLATKLSQGHTHRKIATGGDIGSWSGGGIAALTSGNLIELWIKGTSDASDVTAEDCSFTIERLK